MAIKRLQNRIAESRFTLPITVVYVLAVWAVGCLHGDMPYIQPLFIAVSAFMMMVLNNSNALIRIYSRMVSCTFLVLTAGAAFLVDDWAPMLVQLCFVCFYAQFFTCYQNNNAPGRMFHAFMYLGVASIFFKQILFFVPFIWMLMPGKLMAFSWRMFWASVIGLVTPYWFVMGYCMLTDKLFLLYNQFVCEPWIYPISLNALPGTPRLVTLAFVLLIAITGTVHFLRSSYNDKIRTRMIYEIFIIMNVLTVVFLVLQPQHYDMLLMLMLVNTAPVAAHYIALTHTRTTNISFILMAIAALALTAYNIWM